jgi:hypothetical protein
MQTGAALEAIDRELDRAIGQLKATALATSPASSEAWDALLKRAHLTPDAQPARLDRYRELKLTRGALPEEFRAAIQVTARKAASELADIQEADPDGTGHQGQWASRHGVLRARLAGLVDREGAAYDALLRPKKPGGGMGGVFARARATSSLQTWVVGDWARHVTLSCISCGAPQEVELEFLCHYCRNPLFREGIGWD